MNKPGINLILTAFVLAVLSFSPRLQAQPNGYPFIDLGDISSTGLDIPVGTLIEAQDGNIYEVAETGDGAHYYGGMFRVVKITEAAYQYQLLYTFAGGSGGAYPTIGLTAMGNTLYGATYGDGPSNYGAIFSVNLDGSDFQTPLGIDLTSGTYPQGHLIPGPGGGFFGVAQEGGPFGDGTVFEIHRETIGFDWGFEGNGFPTHSFGGLDGNGPKSTLTQDPGNFLGGSVRKAGIGTDGPIGNDASEPVVTLYGVTVFGGDTGGHGSGSGTVYKVNSDSTGFQSLHVFTFQSLSNGYDPEGGMVLSGGALFGTTSGGGTNNTGVIFKINTDGNSFAVLKAFSANAYVASLAAYTNSDGYNPVGDLILSGDTLYGTTQYGGPNGGGVVYSMDTNGEHFTVLHSFMTPILDTNSFLYTNDGGGWLTAGLLLSSNTLFGTAQYGGANGGGTVFAIILPSPPSLKIAPSAGDFTVSWPSTATNYSLQQNPTLNPLTWTNFNGALSDDGTNRSVIVIPTTGNAFFRLRGTNAPQ